MPQIDKKRRDAAQGESADETGPKCPNCNSVKTTVAGSVDPKVAGVDGDVVVTSWGMVTGVWSGALFPRALLHAAASSRTPPKRPRRTPT